MASVVSKKVTLMSVDGQIYEVEETVAKMSVTIGNMIEDNCADETIPLPNVKGKVLYKVLEYCKKHAAAKEESDLDLKSWDSKYLEKVDQRMLYDLILASNFLDIKGLLDLGTKKVADMIKGKTPEEIRKEFNIKNDFTPEEEEEIRRESAWAFE